ncbi:putative protein serine/threonine kinase [Tieghemostelium lacteum]|uniref:ABC1 atypical kinase-like domain-containing protein n=1 Tax=Tieghemostelium lacteum TaxID=361077 RepID=A0A152A5N0_TIELA|nr:putative protein serine/threonine kinase [Tieghemostelium lacteum]|eukprot:KYR01542.1 putative protein serine/threonine kinase [Tieghemostelium lacteum]
MLNRLRSLNYTKLSINIISKFKNSSNIVVNSNKRFHSNCLNTFSYDYKQQRKEDKREYSDTRFKNEYFQRSQYDKSHLLYGFTSLFVYSASRGIDDKLDQNEQQKPGQYYYQPLQTLNISDTENTKHPVIYLNPREAMKEITNNPDYEIDNAVTVARIIELSIYFLPSLLTLPCAFIPGLEDLWWRMMLGTIQFSGPCWIKFGQWISTRPDLFPQLLCEKFSQLHSRCPSHSFQITKDCILKSFDIKDLDELFLYFEEEPIASGAIAQVHKAVNKNGQVVVVKVLHPNVKENIENDMTIIYSVLWELNKIPNMKWLSLPESIIEFGKSMTKQVDLTEEAIHLSRFIENFKNNPDIIFPKPILSSQEVLVETYEPGVPIMNYIKSNNNYNPSLARIGLNAYMQMMLIDNFIHADLHPGNVMVRSPQDLSTNDRSLVTSWNFINRNIYSSVEKSQWSKPWFEFDLIKPILTKPPKLVLLDVGLVTQLTKSDNAHFKELFTEVLKGNGKAGAELIIKYSREAQCTEQEMYEFKEKLGHIFNAVQNSKISEVHIGHLMGDVLSLVREYHVKIESNFATLVMGTIILEGLGKQLDPNLSLLKAAIPFLLTRPSEIPGFFSGFFTEFFKYLVTPTLTPTEQEQNINNTLSVQQKEKKESNKNK